uniref:Putative DNA binding, helix-turn-helix domain containing protein n=1 Tax=viral metagenome TaxID=1070528 RepID=A0A6M3KWK3_9ZZZZ
MKRTQNGQTYKSLKSLRKQLGISSDEAARWCGISLGWYNTIERGIKIPKSQHIQAEVVKFVERMRCQVKHKKQSKVS